MISLNPNPYQVQHWTARCSERECKQGADRTGKALSQALIGLLGQEADLVLDKEVLREAAVIVEFAQDVRCVLETPR